MGDRIAVVRNPKGLLPFSGPTAVTVGNFDGIHLGHQTVLRRLTAVAAAAGARSVVISFYPHPSVVLGRAASIPQLTTLRQKAGLLEKLGVSMLILVRFTKELAALPAGEFIDRYFLRMLGATHVVLGPDTALGRNREGTLDFITGYLEARGVAAESVETLEPNGRKVSSRRIRELLSEGNVTEASALLGRLYRLEGRVHKGDARGRAIGVPTANIRARGQLLPKHGVYASMVQLHDGTEFGSVSNIGIRPTFGGTAPSIETHLFSFDGDLYGKRIEVGLVERIRGEQKFSGVEPLKAQIQKDIDAAKRLVVK